jgi:general stress protein YciG
LAGKKGGKIISQNRRHMSAIGKIGGKQSRKEKKVE